MKIIIVGCGEIGNSRIEAIRHIQKAHDDITISSIYDINSSALEKTKNKYNLPASNSLEDALATNPNWVFICTSHDVAPHIIKKSFEAGANVLVEKPLGRSLEECQDILKNKPQNLKLHVGFNYRFFAGVEAALNDCKNNKFGRLISVNLTLGHGNSPGMENSWKLDPNKCGGGCLIDPGVHMLDLILKIANGDLTLESSKSWSGFWKTGIEEESHLMLSDSAGTLFNAQVSLNRWKSTFRLEINGEEGYGIVEGRGRSYGPQSYRTGIRWGWQSGKSQSESETMVIENNACQDSFIKETLDVLSSTNKSCNHVEAEKVMGLLKICQVGIK